MRPRRQQRLFQETSRQPFKLSRSRLELFVSCPRCFYLNCKFGIKQPGGFPFTLNAAVDHLLKKEFDLHRAQGRIHPLMKAYKIDAVPFSHPELDKWRDNFFGVQHLYEPIGLLITGAIDDIWMNKKGELYVVDYKATSKNGQVTLDADWQDSYKRQMEIYQWLLRRNGFTVSDVGYFVYCNGRKDREAFDGKLEFDISIIPYRGNDAWVEAAIERAARCLKATRVPKADPGCEFCSYRAASLKVEAT